MEQNNISNFKTWTWYLPLWFSFWGNSLSIWNYISRSFSVNFLEILIQVRSLLKPGLVVPALDILHKLPYGTAEFTLRYYYNVILEGLQLVTLPYSPPSTRHPICYFVICTAQISLWLLNKNGCNVYNIVYQRYLSLWFYKTQIPVLVVKTA